MAVRTFKVDDIVVPRNIVVCEYDYEDGMNIIKMITISPYVLYSEELNIEVHVYILFLMKEGWFNP